MLAGKQSLLAGLQEIESQLAPYRSDDPEARLWASPNARQACAAQAAACGRMLEEILSLERAAESELKRRRDQAALQLQGMHGAARAAGAYAGGGGESASQFDASSEG
jgi:hypothetical protein